MKDLSDNEYYKELIGYWKSQDVLITRRAAIFVTGNSILFFAFRTGLSGSLLLAALLFALTFNVVWFLLGQRTKSTYNKMFVELARLEGFKLDERRKVIEEPCNRKNLFYWNLVRRRAPHISATRALCSYVPILFFMAWIVFYILSRLN